MAEDSDEDHDPGDFFDDKFGDWSQHRIFVRSELRRINRKLDNLGRTFVYRNDFRPVQTLVYGFCGLVLTGVVAALLTLVVRAKVVAEVLLPVVLP